MQALDDIDRRILRQLQNDASLSVADLAALTGVQLPGATW